VNYVPFCLFLKNVLFGLDDISHFSGSFLPHPLYYESGPEMKFTVSINQRQELNGGSWQHRMKVSLVSSFSTQPL